MRFGRGIISHYQYRKGLDTVLLSSARGRPGLVGRPGRTTVRPCARSEAAPNDKGRRNQRPPEDENRRRPGAERPAERRQPPQQAATAGEQPSDSEGATTPTDRATHRARPGRAAGSLLFQNPYLLLF